MSESPREILAQADHHRKTVDTAEAARTKIRLSQKPVARGGLLGFLRRDEFGRDVFFTAEETSAIYEALAIVRNRSAQLAAELEARVKTADTEATR